MNKKSIATILCLLGLAGIYWLAQAGDLGPPGPPATTGHNLQQIWDKADECRGAGQYAVPKTGQTVAHDPWDDGFYQFGVSVETRFTEHGNGTVTDNLTGLIWLQDANCFGPREWAEALSDVNALASRDCDPELVDDPGTVWRLPTVNELESLLDYSEGIIPLPFDDPFNRPFPYYYWSSTTLDYYEGNAWIVNLYDGGLGSSPKDDSGYVWPVTGGQ